MDPVSQRTSGQIPNPDPAGQAMQGEPSGTRTTSEQTARPEGAYTGPDRRARGFLIAEVLPEGEAAPPTRGPGA